MMLLNAAANFDPQDYVGFTFFTGYMAMMAATVFFLLERGRVSDAWKSSLLVSGLITGIAAVHYFYMRDYWMATGQSPVVLRYIDWTLTVPLMCVEFYLITKKAGGTMSLLWKLIAASVAMLVLGYIGEAVYAGEGYATQQWVYGALSGAAYFYILWLVWKGEVAQLAANAGPNVATAVRHLRNFVLVGWAIYPIGYILGTHGGLFGIDMGHDASSLNLFYNLADAVNKIGFGLVIYALAIKDNK
jgi:sensory rhodopsin